mmetsp:Transcript_42635/g.132671  ORF Transcript_42635/g.132671 Transcript_42635/m.132671 type:complete len:199 (+) Transcript_42635:655-1251(+)
MEMQAEMQKQRETYQMQARALQEAYAMQGAALQREAAAAAAAVGAGQGGNPSYAAPNTGPAFPGGFEAPPMVGIEPSACGAFGGGAMGSYVPPTTVDPSPPSYTPVPNGIPYEPPTVQQTSMSYVPPSTMYQGASGAVPTQYSASPPAYSAAPTQVSAYTGAAPPTAYGGSTQYGGSMAPPTQYGVPSATVNAPSAFY